MLASAYLALIQFATAKAGKICPPVPPPLSIMRYGLLLVEIAVIIYIVKLF